MKQTIVIKPIDSTSITLFGEYRDPDLGEVLILDMNGEVHKGDLPLTKKRFMHNFNKQNDELKYNFSWKDDPKSEGKIEEIKRQKEEKILFYWKNHPYIKVEGNETKKYKPLFSLEVVQDMQARDFEILKTKGLVFNTLNGVDMATMRSICFMFGGDPSNMSEHELFIDLVDFKEGRLMIGERPKEFLNKWDKESNPDMEYIVNVKKAITYKIIETKNNAYFIGNQVIGTDVDVVISYMKSNTETYEKFVKEQVLKKESQLYQEEVAAQKKKTQENFMPSPTPDNWAQQKVTKEIRDKAKEMGIKGYHIKSVDKLNKEISDIEEAGKAEKSEV
jgi:hypothetical protein